MGVLGLVGVGTWGTTMHGKEMDDCRCEFYWGTVVDDSEAKLAVFPNPLSFKSGCEAS